MFVLFFLEVEQLYYFHLHLDSPSDFPPPSGRLWGGPRPGRSLTRHIGLSGKMVSNFMIPFLFLGRCEVVKLLVCNCLISFAKKIYDNKSQHEENDVTFYSTKFFMDHFIRNPLSVHIALFAFLTNALFRA